MSSDGESDSVSDREYFVLFLEYYKECRCLWDTSAADYSNRDLRTKSYERLLKVFKQVRDSMKTGSGIQDIYCPKLWYYEYLTFLDEKDLSQRTGQDSLDDGAGSSGSITGNETQNDGFAVPPTKIKKKKQDLYTKQSQILDQAQKILTGSEDNDWEVIGKSIGLQLKVLTEEQSAIAQKIISDALFYAKMKKLTINSQITLEPTYLPSPSPQPHLPHKSPSHQYTITPSPSPSPQPHQSSSHRYTITSSPSPSPKPHQSSSRRYTITPSPSPCPQPYQSSSRRYTITLSPSPSPQPHQSSSHWYTIIPSSSHSSQAHHPSSTMQSYTSSYQTSTFTCSDSDHISSNSLPLCNATETVLNEECTYSLEPPVISIPSPLHSSTSNYMQGALKDFIIFTKK
ncbi:unnamed protein product [Parnassius apollo]|uniref:(apollo) hypothetical protein n=1 Tax=Parnassius apollo TaxID=110799 RepID=A0A8S3WD79_PARAO|nr:unnamed protein product [Parnassius apollo]